VSTICTEHSFGWELFQLPRVHREKPDKFILSKPLRTGLLNSLFVSQFKTSLEQSHSDAQHKTTNHKKAISIL
jgi:hypothetical protein